MNEQHLDTLTILAFAEGSLDKTSDDRAAAHVQACDECFDTYEELLDLVKILKDPLAWDEPSALTADYGDVEFDAGRRDLQTVDDESVKDQQAADALLIELAQQPMSQWEAVIGANPHVCTSALVQRFIDDADSQMFRKPEAALMLLRIAESVALRCGQRQRADAVEGACGTSVQTSCACKRAMKTPSTPP